ncbi:MAG: hypothetical protein HY234_03765 [Acidobacteria bacterium]|nr:hypothetical protein [Acidobacteriota bacterium]MBI3662154.1 hypothetical protein [Acidobacteriota bacterium]
MSESDSQPGGGLRAEDRRPEENAPRVGGHSALRALVAEGHPVMLEKADSLALAARFTGQVVFTYRGGYRVGGALMEVFDRGR